MRFELLEALLRVAITVRDNEGQEELSPAVKVRFECNLATDKKVTPNVYALVRPFAYTCQTTNIFHRISRWLTRTHGDNSMQGWSLNRESISYVNEQEQVTRLGRGGSEKWWVLTILYQYL